jgi:transposase
MSKARLVITAVTVEKRPVSEVARSYGIARSWVYELLGRYRAEGEAAFEPRSRRPKTSPQATAPDTVQLIIGLRKELAGQGPGRRAALAVRLHPLPARRSRPM